jgi:hypothetical protein
MNEFQEFLAKLEALFIRQHERAKSIATYDFNEPFYGAHSHTLDSSGNLPVGKVLQPFNPIPAGKVGIVTRIILWADGYDPSNVWPPDTNTPTWVGIYSGNSQGSAIGLEDYSPETIGTQVFPSRAEYNRENAPFYKTGEFMTLTVAGGPPSTKVSVFTRGRLAMVP